MLNYTRRMNQDATYWPPIGNDGFGNTTHGAPRTVLCRWQDDAVLFRDVQGREQVSSAVVYSVEPLELKGYLYLGETDAADPRALEGAHEIRQRAQSPDLTQTKVLNKLWL